jgi:hypothetical protein
MAGGAGKLQRIRFGLGRDEPCIGRRFRPYDHNAMAGRGVPARIVRIGGWNQPEKP